MRIRKRLFLLSGGYYGQLGNVYGVQHDQGLFLVDSGTPDAFSTICDNLKYWGFHPEDVTHVLLTHGHDDHAGSAAAWQQCGAKILIGSEDAYMLQNGNLGNENPFSDHHEMPICYPDVEITEDTVIDIGGVYVQIYQMPGHTDGSLIFTVDLDQDRLLFTGDMFCCDGEKGDQAMTWWKGDLSYDAHKLEKSIERLWGMNLNPTIVMGGHMIPRIGKDANSLIRTTFQYYLLNNR